MPKVDITDQNYLLSEQYRDASNLSARAGLHERFSVNTYGWHRWVFDFMLSLPADSRILELGCGPAWLWRNNLTRIPAGWQITLSDMSPGMIEQARERLGGREGERGRRQQTMRELGWEGERFNFEVVDAQEIPFDDKSFDAVVANHMLYHVPDRQRALAEIRRVLRNPEPDEGKLGGRLFAATNGEKHMLELRQMIRQCVPGYQAVTTAFNEFGLENGAAQLSPWFEQVALHPYEDALVITEAEPLIAYVQSSRVWGMADDARQSIVKQFAALVDEALATDVVIRIQKASGLFEAWGIPVE